MDIEKLIEQLNDFNENHIAVLCGSGQCACGYLCDKDDCIVVRAAAALSTLQAENEKLRAEMKRLKSMMDEKGQDLWSAENQRADRLEAELNDLRSQWDMYGGDEGITAMIEERDTLNELCENLHDKLEQERDHRLHAEEHADLFLEDCKRLNAELENYRKGHCSEGGCAAEKDRDLIIADNDRLRAELERVKRDFDGICKYIDSEGFLRKQFCENGNSDLEPCNCPSLKEHPGYIDSDDCEGCDHFCNSWRGQKED